MHYFDLAIILVYLIAITVFGARFRSGQKNLRDYFLGGRTAPWWAIALSIVSAETSTLTIVGTPALAYGGNLGFLQIVLGYLLARIVISVLFLPQYFRGEMFTAYELMRRRFGEHVRKLTASIFLVTRALAEGVRVFAISLVISIVLGTGEIASIVLIVLLTLFYTFEGGMTAVIWTDVVQMTLYVAGAIASFIIILGKIPGGWEHVAQVAGEAHKFAIFDFRFAPNMEFFARTYSFWAGLAGGCFLTTATHGTDQLMVQRLLSARDERQSRTALMASWVVILIQFTLFLLIGVLLYVHYTDLHLTAPAQRDRLYPEFVWNNLPPGIAGLIIAAILAAAMANLSAALNSLASTTVVDFYRARAKHVTDTAALRIARLATVAWGGVLLAIAIAARHSKSVLEAGLTIGSIPMGALLGVFLLGVLTRRPREGAAMAGVAAGLSIVVGIHFYTPIAWTWYVLIGTVTTFAIGLFASLFQGAAPAPLEPAVVRQPIGGLPHLPSQQSLPEE
jgi:SSS family solute:Na+ symporter